MNPNDELKLIENIEDVPDEVLIELSNGIGDDEEDD